MAFTSVYVRFRYPRCMVFFGFESSNIDQIKGKGIEREQRHQNFSSDRPQTKTIGVTRTLSVYPGQFKQYNALLYFMSSWNSEKLIQSNNRWHIRFVSHIISAWQFAKLPSAMALNSHNKKERMEWSLSIWLLQAPDYLNERWIKVKPKNIARLLTVH